LETKLNQRQARPGLTEAQPWVILKSGRTKFKWKNGAKTTNTPGLPSPKSLKYRLDRYEGF
jgi:hypothetical protein